MLEWVDNCLFANPWRKSSGWRICWKMKAGLSGGDLFSTACEVVPDKQRILLPAELRA